MDDYFKKDTGLYGDDLLKAMELNEFYPSDSRIDDDVSMYGYGGVIERLIAHCQSYAHYASKDGDKKEFEFHKQAALVMREAIKKLNEIDVPESLEGRQPYGDGRL